MNTLSATRKKIRKIIVPFDEIGKCFAGLQFDNCLDVGSGTGVFLEFFYQKGIIQNGFGVEIDEKYYSQINQDIVIAGENAIHAKKFMIILFNDVLHHVKNKKEFMDYYIDNYLHNNGYVFIKEMNDKNILCRYFNRLHDLVFARQIISEISPATITSYFSGYHTIAEGGKKIFLYDHYWMLFKKQ